MIYLKLLRERRTQGNEIILVGNVNEQLGEHNNGIELIAGELGIINLMSHRHACQPSTTFARGSHCIDYGFATSHVVQTLSICGYEAFHVRFSTDHRSYFFNIDIVKLFGRPTLALATSSQRILQSTNVKQVTKYIKKKCNYLCRCNEFERAQRLACPGDRHQFAEQLDKDSYAPS